MPFAPPPNLPRCGVVDLGSNSVRLVVYEGHVRNPMPIFNEKAVLRLGRGLHSTGRLNPAGVEEALMVLRRYQAVCRAMGAHPFEILATAAVRDASNGAEFVSRVRSMMPEVPVTVLSGHQEAEFSADGVLFGIPDADGVLADIGGGSMEVVRLNAGERGASQTLGLGVIRLAERSANDTARAADITDAMLATVPWLSQGAGKDLYLVGGAWRALARIQIASSGYPLQMVHHYELGRDDVRDLTSLIGNASRRALERWPGAPRRRLDDMPFAAIVLRRLMRVTNARRVVFSASGLREGWLLRHLPEAVRRQDPMIAAGRELAALYGRDPTLPPALVAWSDPLFAGEDADARRLREAACWMSDIGSHDHPEFRAEQAFLRVLRQPGIGLDHPTRAFLALAVAFRYEAGAEAAYLRPARLLTDVDSARRAELLGMALRLAYTLSAGTTDLLAGTSLRIADGRLTLCLNDNAGVFAGESVVRRLNRLAQILGLEAATEMETPLAEVAE